MLYETFLESLMLIFLSFAGKGTNKFLYLVQNVQNVQVVQGFYSLLLSLLQKFIIGNCSISKVGQDYQVILEALTGTSEQVRTEPIFMEGF